MKYVTFFILSLLFWLLITFSLSIANIVTGLAVAMVTTLFFGKMYVENVYKFIQPKRYGWLVLYIFVFTWECIKANFDVAYRVLHPRLPVKPGIVRVPLTVRSEMGRTILANSITMTPGTISVDIIDDHIFVHWIYVSSEDPEIYAHKIAGRFEKYIGKIFD